jgi:guanosine-3',5'-bis(diphosphate) 3'-pyrophosphohydrolase
MSVNYLIRQIQAYNPDADCDLLRRSFEYSQACHHGQQRISGDPYFIHCLETAKTLVELKLDTDTICAGLLHDVLEDTPATRDELVNQFGETITELVEGVTNISKYKFKGGVQQRQAENYLRLLLATARDTRVILIKLADRLHNMQTLASLPPHKQERIAKQTFEVYAPLAHRLGIALIKSRLEDLAFKYLHANEYREIADLLAAKLAEREAYTKWLVDVVQKELDLMGVKARVYGRPKHIYSIYQKIHQRGVPFEEIRDLFGLRVLVNSVGDCYAVIGILHNKWNHIPEQFKDFIGLPKANGYRSLHTTILDRAQPVEIQIRTHEIHQIAEYGIAAHWRYKEGMPSKADNGRVFAWFREMLTEIQEFKDPFQFIRSMKGELFPDEVFVFTPKGDLHSLPAGSTPIDFAYKIHTDIGQTCCGAEVNGAIVPLKYRLQNGDRVKIQTRANGYPSRDWLRWVKTARARNKIQSSLNEQNRAQAIDLGKRLLELDMRQRQLSLKDYLKSPQLLDIAGKLISKKKTQLSLIDELFRQIGNGKESATHIANLLQPESLITEKKEKAARPPQSAPTIELEGIDLDIARIMKCCHPIPGDEIIGYLTRGRGISVHKADCPRIINEPERIVDIEWTPVENLTYPAPILVECDNRPGVLAEITTLIAQYKVNIDTIGSHRLNRETGYDQFTLEVNGIEQLEAIMESIRYLKGVRSVTRITSLSSEKRPSV